MLATEWVGPHKHDDMAVVTVTAPRSTPHRASVGTPTVGHGAAPCPAGRWTTRRPSPPTLRLDCGGLLPCDSMGWSGLPLVHRRTTAPGVSLHLEERHPHSSDY